jgi:hypothetical protein
MGHVVSGGAGWSLQHDLNGRSALFLQVEIYSGK